jgi:HEAT repeat protein
MTPQNRIDLLMESLARYETDIDYYTDPQPFLAAGGVLIELLRGQDAAGREAAARALGDYAAHAERVGVFAADLAVKAHIIDALTDALTDSDWGTRQSAAEMLMKLDCGREIEAGALLLADLESDDAEIRLGAAFSLARCGDEQSRTAGRETLVRLMGHWQSEISAAAALAVAELGDRRAIPALQSALYSPITAIRQAAKAALQRLGAGI